MQREQVLSLLRHGPKTTFELRNHGICQPASRVKELRMAGHRIDTVLTDSTPDHRGLSHHNVAKYVLVQEVAR